MNRLGVKLGILYIFLMVLNISFFTILIHTNQVDLIVQNKKYESLELASNITSEINILIEEINRNPRQFPNRETIKYELIDKCNTILSKVKYILFYLDGRVIHELYPGAFPFEESYLREAQNAVTRREFSNKSYTASFKSDKEINIYIPLDFINMDTIILLFSLDISNIHDKLSVIYRLVIIFIVVLAVFHIVFAIILHRTVISPINILSAKSTELQKGNYNARVKLKRSDEFGILSNAFNHMASSIQEKIESLDAMNQRLKRDLQMAGEVQKSIYPTLRNTEYFNIAIYHNPLIEVSGDYHDIFPLGDSRYGCIIADVCGHGVSAALITMLIKEKCEDIAAAYTDSKEFLKHIYSFFSDLMKKYDKFFTAFYMIIDRKLHTITFSNAGLSSAFLLRENKAWKLKTNGMLIGFSTDLRHLFESKKLRFNPGDKILIITDGIYEAMNPDRVQFGYKRVLKVIQDNNTLPCNKILETIISELSTHRGNMDRIDDETCIIIDIIK
ncbi:MAG: SpoIIE family protein phosphatase [Spirochaetales bacterium]|nr:SpoIIE family protein phosphatase [Spirochaetales bacterium]